MDSLSRLWRGVPVLAALAAALAAVLAAVLASSPAQAGTPLREAEQEALDALKVERGNDPVIVFRQRKALKPSTIVRQVGPVEPLTTKQSDLGIREGRAPVALRVPSNEGAWLFYADVLVGKKTGRVRGPRAPR